MIIFYITVMDGNRLRIDKVSIDGIQTITEYNPETDETDLSMMYKYIGCNVTIIYDNGINGGTMERGVIDDVKHYGGRYYVHFDLE